jgi:hypothetical protein
MIWHDFTRLSKIEQDLDGFSEIDQDFLASFSKIKQDLARLSKIMILLY